MVLCQGYSLLKQTARHRERLFKLARGYYTASLCAPKKLKKVLNDKLIAIWRDVEEGAPFAQFLAALDTSTFNERLGSRFEPVISVNFELLKPENRNFGYVCKKIILRTMRWTKDARALYSNWFKMYTPEVGAFSFMLPALIPIQITLMVQKIFPGVLRDFSYIFRTALEGMIRFWRANKHHLGLIGSEATSTLERLSVFMFTGNTAKLPTRVWKWLGLYNSLERHGWPFIMPGRIDFMRIPDPKTRSLWLTGAPDGSLGSGTLVLTHLSSVKYHFGEAATVAREAQMTMLTHLEVTSVENAIHMLRMIIRRFMIPEFRDLVTPSFREQQSRMVTTLALEAIESESAGRPQTQEMAFNANLARETLLKQLAKEQHPFNRAFMNNMIKKFYQCPSKDSWRALPVSSQIAFPSAHIDALQPADLAALILHWNPDKHSPKIPETGKRFPGTSVTTFCKAGMYWLYAIFEVVTIGEVLSAKDWQEALASALRLECIEVIPGPYNGVLSGRRFTKILDYTGLDRIGNDNLGGRGRRGPRNQEAGASQAAHFSHAIAHVRQIPQFPLAVPLTQLPGEYVSGMNSLIAKYTTKPPRPQYSSFFRRAANALQLNNPAHNLFVLMGYVLTMVSPPPVADPFDRNEPDKFTLSAGVKLSAPRDEWLFIFVVRCLMFCEPEIVCAETPGVATSSDIIKLPGKLYHSSMAENNLFLTSRSPSTNVFLRVVRKQKN